MPTLSQNAQKWLKAVHLFFVALWVGGAVSLFLMQTNLQAQWDMELYGLNRGMRFVDDFVIIPGAFGCLLTGLMFSAFTKWGFFRHGWITFKWVINISCILFGTFWLGPWLNSLAPMARAMGLAAYHYPLYAHNMFMNTVGAGVQLAFLMFALCISTLKPWKSWRKK